MGWRSGILIVILTFAILFSFMYSSYQLNYVPPHDPDTIPTKPKISQAQVIDIVEREYRERVPGFEEAYLHFNYYNYSQELHEEDEQYQRYLRSLGAGWKLSDVKAKPELLSLILAFVHANGTVYLVDPESQEFEKVCEKPSVECIMGSKGGEAARDRLVYEVGAIVEGRDNGFNNDIHLIVDAETGKVVYSTPIVESKPVLPRTVLDNRHTMKELNQLIENTRHGTAVEIVQNASEIARSDRGDMKGFKPAQVRETLFNATMIVWFNRDEVSHTVTTDEGYVDLLGNKFDSGIIEPGKDFDFVFIEPGDYPYHCEIHPWMQGTIEIVESFS